MQSFSSGRMSAVVSPNGGRYLEDGLVVPGKHLASARDKQQLITILKNKLPISGFSEAEFTCTLPKLARGLPLM